MSIQKKSLISTLKTTKKANIASGELDAKPTNITSKKMVTKRLMNRSLKRSAFSRRAVTE